MPDFHCPRTRCLRLLTLLLRQMMPRHFSRRRHDACYARRALRPRAIMLMPQRAARTDECEA